MKCQLFIVQQGSSVFNGREEVVKSDSDLNQLISHLHSQLQFHQ